MKQAHKPDFMENVSISGVENLIYMHSFGVYLFLPFDA